MLTAEQIIAHAAQFVPEGGLRQQFIRQNSGHEILDMRRFLNWVAAGVQTHRILLDFCATTMQAQIVLGGRDDLCQSYAIEFMEYTSDDEVLKDVEDTARQAVAAMAFRLFDSPFESGVLPFRVN